MKDIKGWENRYAVSPEGKIWSYWNNDWMKPNLCKNRDWYASISFLKSIHGKRIRKGYKIHRLVAQTFIPNPLNFPEVNHKNGNKGDNRVENLEWCNRKQNLEHGFKIYPISKRKYEKGSQKWNAKLTEKQVAEIKKECVFFKQGRSARALAKKYGVSSTTIQGIINGIYWKHIKVGS